MISDLISNELCDLNISDNNGITPLLLAIKLGHTKIVNYLTEQNDTNLKCTDKNGRNPMHYAAMLKSISIMKILHRKGLSHNIPDLNGILPIDIAIEMKNRAMIDYLSNISQNEEEEEEEEYIGDEFHDNKEGDISMLIDTTLDENSGSDCISSAEKPEFENEDIV